MMSAQNRLLVVCGLLIAVASASVTALAVNLSRPSGATASPPPVLTLAASTSGNTITVVGVGIGERPPQPFVRLDRAPAARQLHPGGGYLPPCEVSVEMPLRAANPPTLRGERQWEAIPTIGLVRGVPPSDPRNGALPWVKMPPSDATR